MFNCVGFEQCAIGCVEVWNFRLWFVQCLAFSLLKDALEVLYFTMLTVRTWNVSIYRLYSYFVFDLISLSLLLFILASFLPSSSFLSPSIFQILSLLASFKPLLFSLLSFLPSILDFVLFSSFTSPSFLYFSPCFLTVFPVLATPPPQLFPSLRP